MRFVIIYKHTHPDKKLHDKTFHIYFVPFY